LGVLQSIFNGLQEMAFPNAAAVLQGVCMVGVTVALFHAGFGFRGVICAAVLSLLVAVVFLLVFIVRLMPSLKLASFIREPGFLPVLRFGATMQLVVIASVVVAYADRALISHFLGLIFLAKYQLGYTLIGAMRGAVLLLASAVVPAASDLAARNDRGALQSLYCRGTKYAILLALAIGSAIITLAPAIARAWLGHDDPLVTLIFRFLASGQIMYVITGLGASMCRGMGLVALEAKFGVWLTILQTTIGTVTVRRFGLLGLLCSTGLVTSGTSAIFLYKFHRSIQHRYRSFSWLRLVFTPAKAAALASCLVALSSRLAPVSGQSRLFSIYLLTANIILFVLIYALVVLRSSYLDDFDRQLFSRLPGGSLWTVLLCRGQG
jgi:O-antigen/teichoic acid export membrane protein